MDTIALKTQLYNYCTHYVQERIDSFQKAMKEAQDSANSEEKSSAGDKYETGRAMMQIERDKNAKQLEETLKLKKALSVFSPQQTHTQVALGSLVYTQEGTFYIAISAGKISIDGTTYFAIAPTSPLGLAFMNAEAGHRITFNHKTYEITSIL